MDPIPLPPKPAADLSTAVAPQLANKLAMSRDFARVAQKMYSQNLALAQTNRVLSILRAIDLLILESDRNLQRLSSDISNAIISESPYALVAVMSVNRYGEHFLNLQGFAYSTLIQQSGISTGSLNLLSGFYMSLDGDWLSSKNRNLILNLDNADAAKRLETLGLGKSIGQTLATLRNDFNVRSFYLTKLRARGNLTGVMIVGLEETMPKIDDIELIERVSEPTGIALDNRLLFEDNQRFLKELQANNEHLKELDEAKDEFISMVSHQLRTPLTSMKGFVSMVLDGDTGPLTDPQRGMLQQAFDSSQRMVYLIADLLNASRLRSGKFVIMNRETYLPEVVESEVNQLRATAHARSVELDYRKPADFPKVMLDETKMRQVIMNYLDNALYYTPSGGRIKVELKLTDKTIEYTVTDSGMGVPKAEQAKLFTKFYRAGNARKMRPEGTGLGLYMARKVVVAQGGAIIFKSVEGRGSIFGFVFPRQTIEVPANQPADPATPATPVDNTPQPIPEV